MSGGLDSSVAALLLAKQGYDVIGVTLKMYYTDDIVTSDTNCCSYDSLNEARAFAYKNNFPHYTIDIRADFQKYIINNFINEYLSGTTPNPCVLCNPLIKFAALDRISNSLGCQKVATGHYAKIRYENGRYIISQGIDQTKDQSYVLWGLKQEILSKVLFPLGDYGKEEIKKIASKKGYKKMAEKSESYDICFIEDNDYRGYLTKEIPDIVNKYKGGKFVDIYGNILGEHKGYPFYTIGQRKGLEIAVGEPLYVKEIIAGKNIIVLGKRDELLKNEMIVKNINFVKYKVIKKLQHIKTRIRYHDKGTESDITVKNNKAQVCFKEPVFAITPGQSAVFYEGNDLLGGGIIE